MHVPCKLTLQLQTAVLDYVLTFSCVQTYEDVFFLQNSSSKYRNDWSFYENDTLL